MDISACDLIPEASSSSSLVCSANHIVYAHIIARLSECDTVAEVSRNAAKKEASNGRSAEPMEHRFCQDRRCPLSSTDGACSSGNFSNTSPFKPCQPKQHSFTSLVEKIHEFDDCSYQVTLRRDGSMQVSFTGPSLSCRFFTQACMENVRSLIREHFPTDIATMLPQSADREQNTEGGDGIRPRVRMGCSSVASCKCRVTQHCLWRDHSIYM